MGLHYALTALLASSPHQQPILDAFSDAVLAPACTPTELTKLRATTYTRSKGRNPDSAWLVAESMLCGRVAPLKDMPQLVATEQYGIGDDPGPIFALTSRDKIRALDGIAYGVTIEVDGQDLHFNYNTAGICVGSFTLRFIASDWLLVKAGEACD